MSCKYNNSLYSLNVPELEGAYLEIDPEEVYLENQILNHLEEEYDYYSHALYDEEDVV